jgi:hypothetical protein
MPSFLLIASAIVAFAATMLVEISSASGAARRRRLV